MRYITLIAAFLAALACSTEKTRTEDKTVELVRSPTPRTFSVDVVNAHADAIILGTLINSSNTDSLKFRHRVGKDATMRLNIGATNFYKETAAGGAVPRYFIILRLWAKDAKTGAIAKSGGSITARVYDDDDIPSFGFDKTDF